MPHHETDEDILRDALYMAFANGATSDAILATHTPEQFIIEVILYLNDEQKCEIRTRWGAYVASQNEK